MPTFKEISISDLKSALSKGVDLNILDIRTLDQRSEGFMVGSQHLSVYERLKTGDVHTFENLKLSKTTPIVVYCGGGELSKFAATLLHENGFDAYSLSGGYKAWLNNQNL